MQKEKTGEYEKLFSQAQECLKQEKKEIEKLKKQLKEKNYRYSTQIHKENVILTKELDLSCFDYIEEYINYMIEHNPYQVYEERIKELGGEIPKQNFTYDGLKSYVSKNHHEIRSIENIDGDITRINENILCITVPLLCRRFEKRTAQNIKDRTVRKRIIEQTLATLLHFGEENNLYKRYEFDHGVIVFCHETYDENLLLDGDNFDTKAALDCLKQNIISSDNIFNITTIYTAQKGEKVRTKIYALKDLKDYFSLTKM